ncbi:hypothetical protein R5W24_003276 [Gemmata sp. JC717]|uniref:hypothetical protein n=1 Tax=Gemmata algarum TaxID=2975278 RepID=UPI0021BB4A15|nr:hypothetical protein [Gemmata algarum]MDY3554157.1 hypothetical protein [Gemmata algarum]
MQRLVIAAVPAFVLSLAGCGGSNPPAQMPTLSQEQIDALEKHNKDVSLTEKQHEKMLPKAVYIPREEAIIDDAERAHEAALRGPTRGQKKP